MIFLNSSLRRLVAGFVPIVGSFSITLSKTSAVFEALARNDFEPDTFAKPVDTITKPPKILLTISKISGSLSKMDSINTSIDNEKIIWLEIDKIKPHPKNPNKHPQDQIDRLAKIIEYQGWRVPLIISKQSGFLLAGHGRLMAAKKIGSKSVPVLFQDFDDEDQEYAFMTSDNAITEWAELNLSQISDDLQHLDGSGFDIDLLGIQDFNLLKENDLDNKPEKDSYLKPFIIEITLPSEDEMMELYDELTARGLIVKAK